MLGWTDVQKQTNKSDGFLGGGFTIIKLVSNTIFLAEAYVIILSKITEESARTLQEAFLCCQPVKYLHISSPHINPRPHDRCTRGISLSAIGFLIDWLHSRDRGRDYYKVGASAVPMAQASGLF